MSKLSLLTVATFIIIIVALISCITCQIKFGMPMPSPIGQWILWIAWAICLVICNSG